MKRIVKKPDIRKAEILAAAEKLFQKKGYENTPVEAIIKKVGIAKGTFYYYFKTKNDILQAIVASISAEVEAHFDDILQKDNLTAVQKLKLMLRGPEKKEKIKPPMMEVIHLPANRELQEELNISAVKKISVFVHRVMEQGHQEGVFTRTVSIESIQIILAGSQFVLDSGLFEWSEKERLGFLKAIQQLFELVAGAKPNLLNFIAKE